LVSAIGNDAQHRERQSSRYGDPRHDVTLHIYDRRTGRTMKFGFCSGITNSTRRS